MAKRKFRKRIKRNVLSISFMCAMIICVAWFVSVYNNLSDINKKYEEDIEYLESRANEKKRELTLKKAQINYYKSDEYIEKIAREEAGLVMPNELVFIQTE